MAYVLLALTVTSYKILPQNKPQSVFFLHLRQAENQQEKLILMEIQG